MAWLHRGKAGGNAGASEHSVRIHRAGQLGATVLADHRNQRSIATNAGLALAFLLMMALSLPLFMAIWFAPTLVVLHRKPAVTAMVLSFVECLRNLLPFLLFGVIGLLFAIAATIPLLMGWFVLGPVTMVGSYVAYREIFFES